jgi:hypothetical protein
MDYWQLEKLVRTGWVKNHRVKTNHIHIAGSWKAYPGQIHKDL